MTDSNSPRTAEQEAEFTRKMVLGILTTLEHKGLLSQAEVDSILRAARLAAVPVVPPARVGPAGAGTHWVKPGQAAQPMDRTTPVAIPDVRAGGAPQTAGRNAGKDATEDSLVIDMELD